MTDSIDLDDVAILGQSVPLGTYIVKAIDFEAGETRKGSAKVQGTYDILEGEYQGLTLTKNYYLSTYTISKGPKKGQLASMGVSEAKTDAHNSGVLDKLPSPFPLDGDKARKALHKAFYGVRLRAVVTERPGKDDDIDDDGNVRKYRNVALFSAGIAKQTGGDSAPAYV